MFCFYIQLFKRVKTDGRMKISRFFLNKTFVAIIFAYVHSCAEAIKRCPQNNGIVLVKDLEIRLIPPT